MPNYITVHTAQHDLSNSVWSGDMWNQT